MAASGPRLLTLTCDRCGASEVDRYHFCPSCGLFVCDRCWDVAQEACLSCTRPGLPVGGALASSIQTTLGRRSLSSPDASANRVARRLAVGPGTGTSVGAERAAQPAPSPKANRRATDRIGNVVRIVALSTVLGVIVLLLPAVFASPDPAPSGASPTAQPTATARATRRPATPLPARSYVVRRGDTLRSIAARFYGDETLWRRIFNANRDRLGAPEELRVGMELRIPSRR